jgi:hypothetical protein
MIIRNSPVEPETTENQNAYELHFQSQYQHPEAYFSDTLSMSAAVAELKLPYGRTRFTKLLRKFDFLDCKNVPNPELLLLGFMKFKTNMKSISASAILTPLLTTSGLELIKSIIPADELCNVTK